MAGKILGICWNELTLLVVKVCRIDLLRDMGQVQWMLVEMDQKD